MIYLRRVVGLLLTSLIIATASGTASAQSASTPTANGFRISPIRNELTIEKGKSQTVSIMVENPSSLPLKARGLVNDFVASNDEDGQPQLLLDGAFAPSRSLKRLVDDPSEVEFGPNERKDIKITVSIPANAAAGGYYGAVRFVQADQKSGSNLALNASVGSLFLVNVPGNIKQHLELVQFSAAVNGSAKKIISSGQISIITRLRNDGDTHEKPYGKIQVKDSHGKVVAEAEINNTDPQANVLPDSIRKFETKLKNSKWFGHYTVTGSFGYNPSNGELINAKTSFWFIPLWIMIAAALLVLALLFGCYMLYRKYHVRSKHVKR